MPLRTTESSSYRWYLLAGVWLLYAAFGLAVTSLAPLVTLIRQDLDISNTSMGLILGIWQFVYIGSAIPCGLLLDKLGTRWSLTLGGLIIAASLVGRGLATDFTGMLVAVMIFGIGGPIISAGAPKVITGLFTGSSRGLAMGIYMTGPAIGGVVSLTLTHSLMLPWFDNDWRTIMFLWGGISVLVSVLWFVLASGKAATPVASVESGTRPVGQLQVFRRIIREPAVLIVLFMSVGVFLFNHGLNNWLPELLRSGGMTLVQAGYWAALPTLVGIAGSLIIPRLATPERRFDILLALCLCAAGASLLLQFSSGPMLATGLLLQGIARSAMMTVLILTLVELPAIGEKYAGTASGFFFSAAEIGGVLGPVMMGLFFDMTGTFTLSLIFLTVISLATGAGAWRLKVVTRQVNSAAPQDSPG